MPVVVITGCNRGLGLEFARQSLADGCHVIATVRQLDSAVELGALALKHAGQLEVVEADVTTDAGREAIVRAVGHRPLDLLINNAGISAGWGTLGQLETAHWREAFAVNAIAPLLLTQALLPALQASPAGTVVMLSSKMGSMGDNTSGGSYVYRSSKAALNAAARSLAIDLRPRNIRVVLLHPGWVLTDMGGPHALIDVTTSVRGMRHVIATLPLERSGEFIAYDGTTIPW